jgi:hypothetical protein
MHPPPSLFSGRQAEAVAPAIAARPEYPVPRSFEADEELVETERPRQRRISHVPPTTAPG